MTIEVAMKRDGTKVVLGHIVPGEIITFSDYSDGSRNIISAHCLPDDSGGEVYCYAGTDYAENTDLRIMPAEAYADQALEATIESGGTYERQITTETRKLGHLVLTHTPTQP